MASSKEKKAKLILEKYEKARRQRQKMNPKWKELDAFDRGEQWDLGGGRKIPDWVPKPVTNFVHLVKTTKRAALAIENPSAMIMGQTPQDHANAQKLQKVVNFVWDRMRARAVVRDILETAKLLGTGIAKIYYEDDGTVYGGSGARYRGEIKIKQIDPAIFYPDPNAFRLQDCEYIHIVYRRPVAWVKKEFGISDIEAREIANESRGEIYNRDYNSEDLDKIIDFHEHYEKVPNDEEIGGFRYQVTYLAGNKIVRDTQPLQPNCYPFAILYDYPQRQDFWGKSTCEIILDNQKLINKVESIMALIGVLLQNPQKVIHKRSGINPEEAAKYGSTPGHVWLSDIDPAMAMYWQQPPQIPSALFNLAEQAKQNIREITGLTEAYMGQTVGSLQTSTGVNSLIERSTMRDRDQMYDFELFIEDIVDLIIKFIIEYYDEPRIARVLKSNDQDPEFFEFIGREFEDLAYDIKVDISSTAPITRIRKQEELDKLLTLQGQMGFQPRIITPQEYVRESDYMNKEMFLERMNMEEIQGANAILQEALTMMVEGLQGGLPPEQVAEMGQAMVEQHFTAMQQGQLGNTAEHSGEMQARQGMPPSL